jgi:hypothetical protein
MKACLVSKVEVFGQIYHEADGRTSEIASQSPDDEGTQTLPQKSFYSPFIHFAPSIHRENFD